MRTLLETSTDEVLLARYAQSVDRGALGAIVSRRWPEAYRLAFRLLGDPGAAEDAAQEAFCALIRGARSYDPARAFGPWFRTLVLNAARNVATSRETRARHEHRKAQERPTMSPSNEGEARVLASDIEEHVSLLPLDERVPVVLHFYEGCSFEEVARLTGSKKPTVQSRVERALGRLRTSLAGTGVACSLVQLEAGLASGATVTTPGAPAAPSVAALEAAAAKTAAALGGPLAVKLGVPVLVLAAVLGAGAIVLRGEAAPPSVPGELAAVPSSAPVVDEPPAAPIPVKEEPRDEGRGPSPSGAAPDFDAALALESEESAPPYPWPQPTPLEQTLARHRLTLYLAQTPLEDALEVAGELVHLRLTLDPSAQELAKRPLRLRLQSVPLGAVLEAFADAVPEIAFVLEPDAIRVMLADKVPPSARDPRVRTVAELVNEGPPDLAAIAEQLARPVTVDFDDEDGETLDGALAVLAAQAGANFVLVSSVGDTEKLITRYKCAGRPLSEVMGAIVEPLSLRADVSPDGIFTIRPASERDAPRPSPLEERRVTVDLRGVTVPALVEALTAQGVEAVADGQAWRSPATFSVIAKDSPVSSVIAAINSSSPFKTWVAHRQPRREVLVIAGHAPGVREALSGTVDPRFTGVAAQLAEQRTALVELLLARRAARARPEIPFADLAERELAVFKAVKERTALLRRAETAAKAAGELPAIEEEIAKARAAFEAAKKAEEALPDSVRFRDPDPDFDPPGAPRTPMNTPESRERWRCEETLHARERSKKRLEAAVELAKKLAAGGRL